MQLPEEIRAAIETLLSGQSTQSLADHYQSLSERYRRETTSSSLQVTSAEEALAYAAVRMPATYGAAAHVCEQAQLALPEFAPQSLLDIGSGPGTAALAAHASWNITQTSLVEPNIHLRTISEHLLKSIGASHTAAPHTLAQADLTKAYDLVMASYVLNEISDTDRTREIARLWDAAGSTFILIEPGTPLGYEIILQARAQLLKLGAHIAAPCPHASACPLAGSERWCHFSTRVERSSLHKRIKGNAALGYEDEKFSYLVATRLQPNKITARLLGHPHGQKLIDLELCKEDGTAETVRLSKRDELYKQAKKLKWGDPL